MDIMEAAQWLREEHQKVEQLVEALDAASRQPPVGGAEQLDRLRALLGEFRGSLLKHFELEEHGGYLATVLARRPTLDRQVQRLRDEHRQFAILIEQIADLLDRTGPDDPLLIQDACARIQSFLVGARDHEQRENAMVADVHNTDIGTSD